MATPLTEPLITSGKREDLADLIAMVDAKDVPFVSMARKGSKPGNTYFRWQHDSLPAPKPSSTVDGTDVSAYDNYTNGSNQGDNTTTAYRVELSNYIQVFRRSVRVSPLSEDIANVAGVNSELAANVAKGIKVLKRDMEVAFCSNQDGAADNGTTGYRTKGLQTWISTTGGSTPAVPSGVRSASGQIVGTSAAASTLTESDVQGLLTTLYGNRGEIKSYDALVGTTLKRAFTNLVSTAATTTNTGTDGFQATRILNMNRDAESSTLTASLDVFNGDFGTLRLHPTSFIGSITYTSNIGAFTAQAFKGLVLDMNLVEVRYGGNVAGVRELPDAGGGAARLIEAVAGLVVHSPLALGKFDYSS